MNTGKIVPWQCTLIFILGQCAEKQPTNRTETAMYPPSDEVTRYFQQFDTEKCKRLEALRNCFHTFDTALSEKLWTGVPCFYNSNKMIVLRAFKDHINIAADSIVANDARFDGYKITPKGMLQIFDDQPLPIDGLKCVIESCGKAIK
jgi:uncharacterized protein YdhG (YjbR/CyaY superfamily)